MKLKKIIPIEINIDGEATKNTFSQVQSLQILKAQNLSAMDSLNQNLVMEFLTVLIGKYQFSRYQSKTSGLRIAKSAVKNCKKHETNIFANISPCYNYLLYFGGKDFVHSYYLDLVILKRSDDK